MGTGTAIGDILIFVGDRGTARIGTAISLGRGMFFLVIFGACASTHGVFFFFLRGNDKGGCIIGCIRVRFRKKLDEKTDY